MVAPIVIKDLSGISEGIETAGSALAGALEKRAERRLGEEKKQEKQTEFGNLLTGLESQGGEIGALATALRNSGTTPDMGLPILKDKLSSSGKITPFDKRKQEKTADMIFDSLEELPKAETAKKNLNRISELSENLRGPEGYFKALVGSQDATEFNALGLTAIESPLKILNPRGVLPIKKIEMVKKLYAPVASDAQWRINGKVKALKSFVDSSEKHAKKLLSLYNEYGQDIPIDKLFEWEAQSESLVDKLVKDKNKKSEKFERPTLENAKEYDGETFTNPKTKERIKSENGKWVKQ